MAEIDSLAKLPSLDPGKEERGFDEDNSPFPGDSSMRKYWNTGLSVVAYELCVDRQYLCH